jgi:hypothetical protein
VDGQFRQVGILDRLIEEVDLVDRAVLVPEDLEPLCRDEAVDETELDVIDLLDELSGWSGPTAGKENRRRREHGDEPKLLSRSHRRRV